MKNAKLKKKLLKDIIGESLRDLGNSNDCLDTVPKAWPMKEIAGLHENLKHLLCTTQSQENEK